MHCTLSSSEYEDLPLLLDVRVMCVSHDLQLETILQSLELRPPHYNLVPRAFLLKVGGAGKGPGIGWSRVYLTP